jgi:hypothetical protein
LEALVPKKKKKEKKKRKFFPPCAKRESLGFYTVNCSFPIVFVVNHNLSSTTIEDYWHSGKEGQIE